MADSSPSRIGQNLGAGDPKALFLDESAGIILSTFDQKVVMRDKHQVRSLQGARSVKFPATWKASAGYHVPGTEVTGRKILNTEVQVDPDDLLVADLFLANIDEYLAHFEVRSEYNKQMGEALARLYDRNVMRTVIRAARSGALFAGDQGGGAITDAALLTDAVKLFDAIAASKEALATKDVPIDSQPINALVKWAQWFLLSRSDRNLNRDRNGGAADNQKMTLDTIDGIKIIGSNITPFGEDTVTTPNETQPDGTTIAVPSYYRQKLGTTAGVVWTPMAAASVMVQDLGYKVVPQDAKFGTLFLASMMSGTRTLRSKCAVELRTGAIPA